MFVRRYRGPCTSTNDPRAVIPAELDHTSSDVYTSSRGVIARIVWLTHSSLPSSSTRTHALIRTAMKTFVATFFEKANVLQLDFSLAVRPACFGGDPLAFERTYAGLTCLVVMAYVAALLILPRLAVVQRALLAKAHSSSKGALLCVD